MAVLGFPCSMWAFSNCSELGLLLEKAMAPHSSTLAWKIPWTEEPGRLKTMGSRRVGHGWATSLSLFTFIHWRRNGNPLQCSCLENPRDRGAWWAAVYGVAQSWTWLSDFTFTFMHWRRNGNPLQCSCLENPRDGGPWWAAVYGVAQSRTWLKWLSSSSSRGFYCCRPQALECGLSSWAGTLA